MEGIAFPACPAVEVGARHSGSCSLQTVMVTPVKRVGEIKKLERECAGVSSAMAGRKDEGKWEWLAPGR